MTASRPWWRRAGLLGVLVLGAVLIPALGIAGATVFLTPHLPSLRAAGFLVWVPFVLLASVAVGLALAPTHLTSLLAGYLFGLSAGLAAAFAAVALGTGIGSAAARRLAPDHARSLLQETRWGRVLLAEMIDASTWKAACTIALARLPPQIPFAVGNLLAVSAGVRFLPLLAGTLAGMLPRVTLVALVGSQLSTWQPGSPLPSGLAGTLVATVLGFGSLAVWGALILRRKGR